MDVVAQHLHEHSPCPYPFHSRSSDLISCMLRFQKIVHCLFVSGMLLHLNSSRICTPRTLHCRCCHPHPSESRTGNLAHGVQGHPYFRAAGFPCGSRSHPIRLIHVNELCGTCRDPHCFCSGRTMRRAEEKTRRQGIGQRRVMWGRLLEALAGRMPAYMR